MCGCQTWRGGLGDPDLSVKGPGGPTEKLERRVFTDGWEKADTGESDQQAQAVNYK